MKRLLVILFLIPGLVFGTYTEFYCQSGGSNLNAGSTTNNTAAYTSTNGSWSTVTNNFTPTDGSTPASTVSVGDFASVYLDAATSAVYIGRVTVVAAGVNGAITVSSTFKAGTAPVTGATGRSIKVGGAWKGPSAAIQTPFNLAAFASLTDASNNQPRINMKNDASYLPNASLSTGNNIGSCTVMGYTSTVGDGGKAVIDFGTNSAIWTFACNSATIADLIFTQSIGSGTADAVDTTGTGSVYLRLVAHGSRGNGFSNTGAGNVYVECESYDNNKSNTASNGGFKFSGSGTAYYCISHDNTGSNTAGFWTNSIATNHTLVLQNCIADTNGGSGLAVTSAGSTTDSWVIGNCDFYNNTGDGITFTGGTTTAQSTFVIRNNNFIKNGGKGINIVTGSGGNTISGFKDNNGYGAGTQANGSADVISSIIDSGTSVTYASNVTPEVDPANGDFRINLATANFAGRGAFTETAASYAGTVGFPDIGAAQSKTGSGGTFNKETSSGHGY